MSQQDDSDVWWSGLNDFWSYEKTSYLTSGNGINPLEEGQWMGDLIFHRFFSSEDFDPKNVKVVLVEDKKWKTWQRWLEKHKTSHTLLPRYAYPLEQVIVSRKSFRIVKWVDEYRPFDFFIDPIV